MKRATISEGESAKKSLIEARSSRHELSTFRPTPATKKVRTCLGRKGRRSSVRGGSMGCRVVLSSCQECNSHAAGIPLHSIPLAASLLWRGVTRWRRHRPSFSPGHLSILARPIAFEREREKERARSGSRNRGSCSRWFRLNGAFRTPSFVSKRLLSFFRGFWFHYGKRQEVGENGGRLGLGQLTLIRTD